jgi:hypothetical protein
MPVERHLLLHELRVVRLLSGRRQQEKDSGVGGPKAADSPNA